MIRKIISQLQKAMKSYEKKLLRGTGWSYLKMKAKALTPYGGCMKLAHDPHAQEEGRSPVNSIKLTQKFESGRWATEIRVEHNCGGRQLVFIMASQLTETVYADVGSPARWSTAAGLAAARSAATGYAPRHAAAAGVVAGSADLPGTTGNWLSRAAHAARLAARLAAAAQAARLATRPAAGGPPAGGFTAGWAAARLTAADPQKG